MYTRRIIESLCSLALFKSGLKHNISEYFYKFESGSFTITGMEYFVISLPTMSFNIYQIVLPLSLESLIHGNAILSSSQSLIITLFKAFICSELLNIF